MRDLFGEIPVYLWEIEAWLNVVPRFSYNQTTRRKNYVRQWNVVEKIQQAKLSGRLPAILGDSRCKECGSDFSFNEPELPANPKIELQALNRRVAVLEMVIQAQAAASALPPLPDGLASRRIPKATKKAP